MALLPERYKQADLFLCDILNVTPKDDMASMEHPLFTLSKKRDMRTLTYEHNGNKIEVSPGKYGLATIFDKDILIYCISQLMAKAKQGVEPQKTVHIHVHDLLVTTNRPTGGESYKRLKAAFRRLHGTTIETNIKTNDLFVEKGFHFIEDWKIVRETKSGRMASLEITLSDWIFNAVLGQEVLTLNRRYFRLSKPTERRFYELARKHCGDGKKSRSWRISKTNLKKKAGILSENKHFNKMLKDLITDNSLPDYKVTLEGDNVIFTKRVVVHENPNYYPRLSDNTFHKAKQIANSAGYYPDIGHLESMWIKKWRDSGRNKIIDPDAAFIGYVKQCIKNHLHS